MKEPFNKSRENLWFLVLVALFLGMVTLVAILGLFSLLTTAIDIPTAAVMPLATIAIAIATFINAVGFSFYMGNKGLIYGAGIGLVTFLIILVVSLIGGLKGFTSLVAIKLIITVLSGAIGGYVGITIKENRFKKIKKRI